MTDNLIYTALKDIMDICSSYQKAYYEQILKDLKPVEVVPISEVFTQEEIDTIKKIINPKPKECYRNATVLTNYFTDNHTIEYVEGYSQNIWPHRTCFQQSRW